MGCNSNDCLNCKHPVCLLDIEDAKAEKERTIRKANRSEYQHEQYLKHMEREKTRSVCKFCGKKCKGEMIRIDAKNYCGMDCVFCYLYEKNEKKMKIIVV